MIEAEEVKLWMKEKMVKNMDRREFSDLGLVCHSKEREFVYICRIVVIIKI